MITFFFYAEDPYKLECQLLINKHNGLGLNEYDSSKAIIEYLNDMGDIYENIEEYNLDKERKVLIVFDDLIANMPINKKRNPIVTELFIRDRKINISFVFITQSYFDVPKNIRLNSTHYVIMKTPNKRELQQIASSTNRYLL